VLQVLREILKVLKFVHEISTGISNIMRHRNGKLYLDFGAVKQVTKAAVGAGSSTGIYSMGFAPEQMAGEKSIHPQTCMPWR